MRFLSLDIGDRRTGVAYVDEAIGVVVPVTTIRISDREALVRDIASIASERKADRFVVGIPFLPSGEEGAQAKRTREVIVLLKEILPVDEVDERFSSHPLREKGGKVREVSDTDTWAACQLLDVYLSRK